MYFQWYFLIITCIPVVLFFFPNPFNKVVWFGAIYWSFYILFVELPQLFNANFFNFPIVNHILDVVVYLLIILTLYFRGHPQTEKKS